MMMTFLAETVKHVTPREFQRAIRLRWERFEVAEDFNQTSGLLTYDKESMWPACHHWARIRIPVAGKISITIKSVPLRENDWSGLKNRIRNSCSATISGIDFAVVLIFATWNCMEKKFHVSLGDIIELFPFLHKKVPGVASLKKNLYSTQFSTPV